MEKLMKEYAIKKTADLVEKLDKALSDGQKRLLEIGLEALKKSKTDSEFIETEKAIEETIEAYQKRILY